MADLSPKFIRYFTFRGQLHKKINAWLSYKQDNVINDPLEEARLTDRMVTQYRIQGVWGWRKGG